MDIQLSAWLILLAGNFARVALAIDYEENGYRCLLPMAIVEPGLMSAVLAVAASHYSRWQKTTDMVSRKYRRAALQALRDRFNQPELIQSPTTLACMLALVTYEVSIFHGWNICVSCLTMCP